MRPRLLLWCKLLIGLTGACLLLLVASGASRAQPPVTDDPWRKTDFYGDPLPRGAVARLGSLRFRNTTHEFRLSPDGKLLILTPPGDHPVLSVCDASSGKVLYSLGDWVHDIGYSPDSRLLATATSHEIQLLDAPTGKVVHRFSGLSGGERGGVFLAGGKYFGLRGEKGWDYLWETATGAPVKEPSKVVAQLEKADGSGANDFVVTQSDDRKSLQVVSGNDGKTSRIDCGGKIYSPSPSISPDGRTVGVYVLGNNRVTCIFYDLATGRLVWEFESHTALLGATITFASDSRFFAVRTSSGLAYYDMQQKRKLFTWRLSTDVYRQNPGVFFTADGKTLALQEGDVIRFFDLTSGKARPGLPGHSEEVWSLVYSTDGKTILSASHDGRVIAWDAGTGRALHVFDGEEGWPTNLCISADGKTVAFATQPAQGMFLLGPIHVRVWDLKEHKQRFVVEVKPAVMNKGNSGAAVALSGDGRRLAVAARSMDPTQLYDAVTGEKIRSIGRSGVNCIALSPDGKTIAIGYSEILQKSRRARIEIVDLQTNELRRTLTYAQDLESIAFSEDGKWLSGIARGLAVAWDLASGEAFWELKKPSFPVFAVDVIGEGRVRAFAARSVVEGEKPVCEVPFTDHAYRFGSGALSPDGKRLAAGTIGLVGDCLVWDLDYLSKAKR